jgi:Lar family restriction alleviation protein
MNNKLKPCPFCGGKVYIDNEDCYGYEHIDFFVHCDNCSLQFGFASQLETDEEVAKAWNTRKPMDKVVKHLEETREKDIPRINNTTTTRDEKVYKLAMSYAIDIVKVGGIDE